MDGAPSVAQHSAEGPKLRGRSYCSEDVALITYLYEKHKWSAPKVAREHPNKNWNVSGVKKILQKVKAGKETTGKPGSGGHNR